MCPDEFLPVGQTTHRKKLVETSSSGTVAELVASWLQPSTESFGILGASTAMIGHVIADASTAKIGALQASTEAIGHVIADASTAKIGALQGSTEVIGHVIADASTAKIGALQGSTEAIGHVIADASTAKIGALQASTENIGSVDILSLPSGNISIESLRVDLNRVAGAAMPPAHASAGMRVFQHFSTPAGADAIANNVTAFVDSAGNAMYNRTLPLGFNEQTFDRWRNNASVTLLASTSRTSTGTSADQTNYNAKAHILYIVCDTSTGAALTPSAQVKDSVSGLYGTAWTGAAITSGSTGLYIYLLDDVASTSSTGYTDIAKIRLGRTWRLVVNPSSSGATQYSASVDNLC